VSKKQKNILRLFRSIRYKVPASKTGPDVYQEGQWSN